MLSHKCLSPLVVHPGKVPGAVCSFGFFVQDGDVLREQHVANAHSHAIAMEFILRWRERGGQIIDLRPQDQHYSQLSPSAEATRSGQQKAYFSGRKSGKRDVKRVS